MSKKEDTLRDCLKPEVEEELEKDWSETVSSNSVQNSDDDFVVIKPLTEQPVRLYNQKGNFVGIIDNVLVYYDVLLQIMNHFYEKNKQDVMEPSGYYMVMSDGRRIDINQNGSHEDVDGLFDKTDEQIQELCRI